MVSSPVMRSLVRAVPLVGFTVASIFIFAVVLDRLTLQGTDNFTGVASPILSLPYINRMNPRFEIDQKEKLKFIVWAADIIAAINSMTSFDQKICEICMLTCVMSLRRPSLNPEQRLATSSGDGARGDAKNSVYPRRPQPSSTAPKS